MTDSINKPWKAPPRPTSSPCALCLSAPRDELSHVIPAFVVRWLKETSPTGFMRTTSNPNLRKQDAIKQPLLCARCEDLFSLWEKKFAEEVFHKIHRGGDKCLTFSCGDWLAKFCVGASWRSMAYLHEANPDVSLPFGHDAQASVATERWRRFVLGNEKFIDPHWQYLLVTDMPVSISDPATRADFGMFMMRGLDCDTMHSANEAYVFTKMCQIVIVGTICDPNPKQWRGPKVGLSGGSFNCAADNRVSGLLFEYFNSAVATIRKAREEISLSQLQKIETSMIKGVQAKGSAH